MKGIEVFRQKFGLKGDFGDIDDIIARIDVDGSGTIDFKEFLTATMNAKHLTQGEVLKQAFDLFDIVNTTDLPFLFNIKLILQDSDGSITKKELQRVLAGVFIMMDQQWDDFIKEVDKNNNGVVSERYLTVNVFCTLWLD